MCKSTRETSSLHYSQWDLYLLQGIGIVRAFIVPFSCVFFVRPTLFQAESIAGGQAKENVEREGKEVEEEQMKKKKLCGSSKHINIRSKINELKVTRKFGS